MAETINPNNLLEGHTYQIYNPGYRVPHMIGHTSRPIIGNFVGINPITGAAQFNNILGLGVPPNFVGNYILSNKPFGWVIRMGNRNTMLRKKNILERPRKLSGLSIKEELIQMGPSHPNRIGRARLMGYRNENDPEGNWEPTVIGYGRSRKNRKSRKSRRN
jgi:hypothetical protein